MRNTELTSIANKKRGDDRETTTSMSDFNLCRNVFYLLLTTMAFINLSSIFYKPFSYGLTIMVTAKANTLDVHCTSCAACLYCTVYILCCMFVLYILCCMFVLYVHLVLHVCTVHCTLYILCCMFVLYTEQLVLHVCTVH